MLNLGGRLRLLALALGPAIALLALNLTSGQDFKNALLELDAPQVPFILEA